jgi:hypothetical protein
MTLPGGTYAQTQLSQRPEPNGEPVSQIALAQPTPVEPRHTSWV